PNVIPFFPTRRSSDLTEDYADAFRKLGVPPACVHVTGSVKYDGVETNRANPRTQQLAGLFGLADRSRELVWIAGSTQDPEEKIRSEEHTSELQSPCNL